MFFLPLYFEFLSIWAEFSFCQFFWTHLLFWFSCCLSIEVMHFNKILWFNLVFHGFSRLTFLKIYIFKTIFQVFLTVSSKKFFVGFQITFESQAEQKAVTTTEHGLQGVLIDILSLRREAFRFSGCHGLKLKALCGSWFSFFTSVKIIKYFACLLWSYALRTTFFKLSQLLKKEMVPKFGLSS